MSKLKVGDIVNWKGAWGSQSSKDAVVDGIEINCINKYDGENVDEVNWRKVNNRSTIISLNNGHWAYGTQITEK